MAVWSALISSTSLTAAIVSMIASVLIHFNLEKLYSYVLNKGWSPNNLGFGYSISEWKNYYDDLHEK